MKDTILLAHYYAPLDVQERADYVGDSLDLANKAKEAKAKRIVFAGVRFMAETAKVLNPDAEVILPHYDSTCSLVTQTNIEELREWVGRKSGHRRSTHVAYINSSAEHKMIADWIVTSRNVVDIITHLAEDGQKVLFSPDRNMGAYLAHEHPEWDLEYWSAVCEVHDKFNALEIDRAFRTWTDGPKYLIAHPESPLPVLERAHFIGSTKEMLEWVRTRPVRATVLQHVHVATEIEMIEIMRRSRPDLSIVQAPGYQGCQCNMCPYMKLNSVDAVEAALAGRDGSVINYLSELDMKRVRIPLDRMLRFENERKGV